jgi:hypothetical protein
MQVIPFLSGLAALLPFLIPLGQLLYAGLGQKFLPQSQANRVQGIVTTVVQGIEQGMQNSAGPDKKAQAVQAVNGTLAHYKIKVPSILVDLLIEEAVGMLNHTSAPSSFDAAGFVPGGQPAPTSSEVPNPALRTFFQPASTVVQPLTYLS